MKQRVRAFWQGLEQREQRILSAGAVITAALLLWGGVWLPLSDRAESLRTDVAEARAEKVWMAQSAERIRQAGGGPSEAAPADQGSLLGRVDRSANSFSLAERVDRIQPDGDARVRVWLERADFDQMLRWLDSLSENGVQVHALSVDPLDTPGRINARLTLEAGS
ncbi:type II secretion system protein M (GspM) [Alkalispirillum mobile]|uniref:Type II secretion system protein M n=1 Tax=Alkalispirillum mobile TaxID=85925 RepID=A0A498BY31_9GAMM|nr:type II secretion system protein M [Alkalispirillum mobile]RLK48355.1 type II secretion system protein M (GspM) [Alkalispirillum mobile]